MIGSSLRHWESAASSSSWYILFSALYHATDPLHSPLCTFLSPFLPLFPLTLAATSLPHLSFPSSPVDFLNVPLLKQKAPWVSVGVLPEQRTNVDFRNQPFESIMQNFFPQIRCFCHRTFWHASKVIKKWTFFFCPSSFIRLADCLIVNTMHVLAVKSVTSLLNYLTEKLKRTPAADVIQKWNTELKNEVSEKKVISLKKKEKENAYSDSDCDD